MYRFIEEHGGFKLKELEELEERGYLKNSDPTGKSYTMDKFSVTDEFISMIHANNPADLFEEFVSLYPNFLFINAKKIPTKGCNMEELEKRYVKLIEKNLPLHKCIIESVEWGKQYGYLNTGILKFFESRAWETIQSEMRYSVQNGTLPSDNEF